MVPSNRRPSHLVVIGSSAGGIESLSAVVATLPPHFPAPVVIAQHLSPTRPSSLVEILERRGVLPVRTVSQRDTLEPGVIYVVPPHADATIDGSEIVLTDEGRAPQPSIDALFSSAAEEFGEDLIAVVLSGTGSDGASGAREVKFAGGTVIIQDPETAAFPDMPLSLAPSIVDIAARREQIGGLLNALVSGEFVVPEASEHSNLQAFLGELREHSGIDFSTYKQPTIGRRLQRRMAATGQASLNDYIRYVHQNPTERQRLVSSFLIKVTEFFRDPELYTYLGDDVLPELIREASARGAGLRLWSAGCATGEEAYSLAMTVLDKAGDDHPGLDVRIFATDLDSDAVTFARRGIYPARTVEHLPDALVERHFIRHGDEYEVNKRLRGMLVFGEHNLGQRSPFPRIDLILCRNVLIYFTPALQRRALQLFAFSLRTGGYLVLGKSETVSPLAEVFTLDQPRLKSYRRVGDRALIPPSRLASVTPRPGPPAARASSFLRPTRQAGRSREPARPRIAIGAGDQVLFGLPVAVVVVDQRYDIHNINSEARRLFGIHTTALEQDFIHLALNFDSAALRGVIDAARTTGQRSEALLQTTGGPADAQRSLQITCDPLVRGDDDERLYVITAIDRTEREHLRLRLASADEDLARLIRANEEVLAANQELARTIVMLRADNEELLVAAEEIQAATEEVETLNEELQAGNEELETLNEELQATVEELNTTNDDLQAKTIELQAVAIDAESSRQQLRAIIDGVDDAVLVVDGDGRIVLENTAHFALVSANKDAVMVDAGHKPIPERDTPVRRAARGEEFSMRFAFGPSDQETWYVASANLRTTANGAETLVVVTIREAPAP